MTYELVNMTPHEITMIDENDHDNVLMRIEPSGETVRLAEEVVQVSTINGFKLNKHTFGSANLPPKKTKTLYVVSALVANAHPERDDFIMVSKAVRNDEGRIVGTTGFATVQNHLEEEE
tara:strand:+ start:176 stop:532 length:357 start_codon:yes stop_codon:yes gene_type:complete